MIGRIHSFQSLGTVDGPGLRCVVFMQGCPLRCACCHNPDTWEFSSGQEISADDLVKKIVRYKNYFGSKGGVTVSGGEPLMQTDFITELFSKLKELGINTALDTSGCIYNDKVEKLLSYTDLVLLDYKYADEESYWKYTLCHKENVDLFLGKLQEKNISTWLRRVIIPGLNDDEYSMLQLKEIIDSHSCVSRTELLPFRKLCIEKYDTLGIEFPLRDYAEPTNELMEKLNNYI